MRGSYYFWLIGYYLFQGGSTLVAEFPSERELLFLVNWLLFVSEREYPIGGVSQ